MDEASEPPAQLVYLFTGGADVFLVTRSLNNLGIFIAIVAFH